MYEPAALVSIDDGVQSIHAETVLRAISASTAATTGGDFFRSLVRQLAEAFQVNMAFVTECFYGDQPYVRSIAAIQHGQYRESFTYDLAGTPCAGVIDSEVCYYPNCLEDLFPCEAGQESYLGAPLHNAAGQVIGHLALVDANPMDRSADDFAIFRLQADREILSVRASHGLPANYVEGLTFPLRQSFLGRAVRNRQPIVVPDLHAALLENQVDLLPQNSQFLLTHFRSLLAIPLMRQGQSADPSHKCSDIGDDVYGGIALYYREAHEFSEDEVELAMAFSHQGALAIDNARLRQQAKQAAVLEERGRLARELHDSVTQSLYSTTLFAEAGRELAEAGDLKRVKHLLARVGETSQQALKEMRLLVYELRPVALEKQGLVGALQQRLDAVEKRAGVESSLQVEDVTQSLLTLPAPMEEALYRITQEALNNALKHANASSITVRIQTDEDQIFLEVADDGKGFDLAEVVDTGGMGLTTMRERAQQFGGSLQINSASQGTQVRVVIEIKGDNDGDSSN